MCFSEKLTTLMQQKKISTRQLADMTGIPKSAIQRYTTGGSNKIPISRLKLMAEALSVDPAFIMGWAPDPDAAPDLADEPPVDPAESELIDIYRSLNRNGQGILLNTARGLSANPDMKNGCMCTNETA